MHVYLNFKMYVQLNYMHVYLDLKMYVFRQIYLLNWTLSTYFKINFQIYKGQKY